MAGNHPLCWTGADLQSWHCAADLDDPTRVISRLDKPILVPNEYDRDGYVPNVVYTCGAMIFQNELIIPFASADQRCGIATLNLAELMARLRYNKVLNGN